MGQTLPVVPVDDLRQRLELDPTYASDVLLGLYIAQAETVVGNELDPAGSYELAENVREAIAQIAVKLWDMRPRGVQTLDMDGSAEAPALPATAGLVRSVRGLLLPSMEAGGITV
jgi:Phage gp6-like head-tail connector protein